VNETRAERGRAGRRLVEPRAEIAQIAAHRKSRPHGGDRTRPAVESCQIRVGREYVSDVGNPQRHNAGANRRVRLNAFRPPWAHQDVSVRRDHPARDNEAGIGLEERRQQRQFALDAEPAPAPPAGCHSDCRLSLRRGAVEVDEPRFRSRGRADKRRDEAFSGRCLASAQQSDQQCSRAADDRHDRPRTMPRNASANGDTRTSPAASAK
jgi:hypothetical protein